VRPVSRPAVGVDPGGRRDAPEDDPGTTGPTAPVRGPGRRGARTPARLSCRRCGSGPR